MKTSSIFLLLSLFCFVSLAHDKPNTPGTSELIKAPQLENMQEVLFKYINTEAIADFTSLEGIEVVSFVVTTSGELRDLKIISSLSARISSEVLRALKQTSGNWQPGSVNGETVDMEHEISLYFKSEANPNKLHTTNQFNQAAMKALQKGNKFLLEKGNPEQALKYYNRGLQYRPYDTSLLLMRGMCLAELGNRDKAKQDWARIEALGGKNLLISYLGFNIKDLEGYTDLVNFAKKDNLAFSFDLNE